MRLLLQPLRTPGDGPLFFNSFETEALARRRASTTFVSAASQSGCNRVKRRAQPAGRPSQKQRVTTRASTPRLWLLSAWCVCSIFTPRCVFLRRNQAKRGDRPHQTAAAAAAKIANDQRPDEAFTTERAVKSGKANASSGRIFVSVPADHFGPIPASADPIRNKGVLVGEQWPDRLACRQWGAHFPHVAGIAGQSSQGAQSVALSGGYEDDKDMGEWFLYTGSGGRDLSGNKRTNKEQSFDQTFEKSNLALKVSCLRGLPVRVVRSHKEKRSSYAPTDPVVRYDGIYRIERCWRHAGTQGKAMCRYLFVRCDNEAAPWTTDGALSSSDPCSRALSCVQTMVIDPGRYPVCLKWMQPKRCFNAKVIHGGAGTPMRRRGAGLVHRRRRRRACPLTARRKRSALWSRSKLVCCASLGASSAVRCSARPSPRHVDTPFARGAWNSVSWVWRTRGIARPPAAGACAKPSSQSRAPRASAILRTS